MSIIYLMLCCSPHKESIDIGLLIVPAAFIGITTFLYKRGLISLGGRQLIRVSTLSILYGIVLTVIPT